MCARSSIEWTDATWNPVTGCDRVSPGCARCYALDFAARLKAMGREKYTADGDPRTSGPGFGVACHASELSRPLRWRKPQRIFVNSMSDLFHEAVPFEFVARVFETMRSAHWQTFQVLTKRAERMLAFDDWLYERWLADEDGGAPAYFELSGLPNVWLGVSIENRAFAWRADALRQMPAAVRFLSCEPLLGPVAEALDLYDVDWVIAGGESGARARPLRPEWVASLRDRCLDEAVPFFFKQWGGRTSKAGGRELDGREWSDFPVAGRARLEYGALVG